MSNSTLFIAGLVITIVAFIGIFMYLMLLFANYSEREQRGTGSIKRQD